MSGVVPPPPPPPSASLAGQTALPTLLLKDIPQALLLAAPGGRLEALVMAELGAGTVRLRLPGGLVEAQVPFRLPAGATLSLAVPASGLSNRLSLVAVNGRPLAPLPGAPPMVPMRGEAPASAAGARPNPEAVTRDPFAGQTSARGVAAGPTVAATAVPGRIVEGSTLTLTLLRPPPSEPGQTAPPAPAATGAPQAAAAPEGAAARLPAGTTVMARVVTIQLPGQPQTAPAGQAPAPVPAGPTPVPQSTQSPPAATPLAVGSALRAEVTGTATGGNPVVQTHFGPMVVGNPTPLPKGTVLVLAPTAEPVLPAPAAPSPVFASRAAVAAADAWPALTEVLTTLGSATPAAARTAAAAIPRPDGSLMALTLQFLSALRTGGIASWIGETPARTLSRLRPELADRIEDDAAQLKRSGADAGADGWRALAFPLLNGQQVELVHLFLRRHAQEETEPGGEHGDRFVLDVRLSRLGRVQLDGFYRPKRKRLDLIVRTERPFEPEVRDEIRGILRTAHETTGMDAAVAFQTNPPSFVDLAPEPAPPGNAQGLLV